jgi:hypothetical protein
MQYKIPVQIENEDPIMLGLSLRQLAIIMSFFWIARAIYNSLLKAFGNEVALIPAIMIAGMWVIIAVFKYSEMRFVTFVLTFIRYKVNIDTRRWMKWVDSFSALDIWYIMENKKVENKVDFEDKLNKMRKLEDRLEKI